MGLEQLSVSDYLISLDDDANEAYAAMRKAEDILVESANGSTQRFRRAIVTVTSDKSLDTDHFQALKDAQAAFLLQAKRLASEQGCKSSVGDRTASPPVWLTPDGRLSADTTATWPMATSVTYRRCAAWRGARITLAEAIDYLNSKIDKSKSTIKKSLDAGQRARAAKQGERLDELNQALNFALSLGDSLVSARLYSGVGTKIRVKTPAGNFDSSVPALAFVYAFPGVDIVETAAKRSTRHLEPLHMSGGIAFFPVKQ